MSEQVKALQLLTNHEKDFSMPCQIDIRNFKDFPQFKKRFLSFFPDNAFKSGQDDICWNWQGALRNPKKRNSYGTISWGTGSHYLSHRLAYIIFNNLGNPDIADKMVRHTCNNVLCVNPNHLILGNHRDNMNDMLNSGTTAKTLNEEAVKVIKWMLKYKPKKGLAAKLAQLYNTTPTNISAIKRGRVWSWVHV
jgi:hypothetical protein